MYNYVYNDVFSFGANARTRTVTRIHIETSLKISRRIFSRLVPSSSWSLVKSNASRKDQRERE